MNAETITVKDKKFKPYMLSGELQSIIENLGKKISEDYKDKDPLFVFVLDGSLMFGADLLKHLPDPCQMATIKVSSYEGTESTGEVKVTLDLKVDIKGRDVVIVEDIVDTGVTMDALLKLLRKREPKSLEVCTLFLKPDKCKKELPLKYVGKNIPNAFIVGYGFDYDGYARNLPDIYSLAE